MYLPLYTNQYNPSTKKIAWINGFIWAKTDLYHYPNYLQVNHKLPKSTIQQVLTLLEQTKKYKQHRLLECFQFIRPFLKVVTYYVLPFIVIAFIITLLDVLFSSQQTNNQNNVDDVVTQVLGWIILVIMLLYLLYPLLMFLFKWRIHKKLRLLLTKINKQQFLQQQKVQLKFPTWIPQICLCLKIKPYKIYDYSTIEFWQCND